MGEVRSQNDILVKTREHQGRAGVSKRADHKRPETHPRCHPLHVSHQEPVSLQLLCYPTGEGSHL